MKFRSCQQSSPVVRFAVMTDKIIELCIDERLVSQSLFEDVWVIQRLYSVTGIPFVSSDGQLVNYFVANYIHSEPLKTWQFIFDYNFG